MNKSSSNLDAWVVDLKSAMETRVPIGFGNILNEVYYDLVNIDRYDCIIIGTPLHEYS